ncbi:MAG: hypothetical protein ACE5GH_07035, partial [Fidelibacterota bacterium]
MRHVLRSIILSLALIPSVLAQDADKRPMTVDDQLDMVQVSNAVISPDGKWVLFSKSELNWKENKRKLTWFKVSTSG